MESATGGDVIAVLDVSRSMLAQDATGSLSPDRLGACLDVLLDLANEAERAGGRRLGLVAFAARPQVLCPLTQDIDFFREAVRGAASGEEPLNVELTADTPATSGTRIGRALETAVGLSDEKNSNTEIVFLSDGDDPAGDREWESGIAATRARGIPVTVVGVGDPTADSPIPLPGRGPLRFGGREVRTRLHEEPLREIARATGGTYVPARTGSVPSMGALMEPRADSSAAVRADKTPARPVRWEWCIAAGLALWSASMILPVWRNPIARKVGPDKSPARPALTRAPLAGAALGLGALLTIWQTPGDCVRAGNRAFDRGNYQQALDCYGRAEERIDDPGLVAFNEGAACFRLGRYHDAERHYTNCVDSATGPRLARCLYDLGNTLVLGADAEDVFRLRRAVDSYERCLALPDLNRSLAADTESNLAVARNRLREAEERLRRPRDRDSNGTGSGHPRDNSNSAQPEPGASEKAGRQARRRGPVPPEQAKPAERSDELREPGAGNLPTVPDAAGAALTPEKATATLKAAVERIRREKAGSEARRLVPPPPDVKDW